MAVTTIIRIFFIVVLFKIVSIFFYYAFEFGCKGTQKRYKNTSFGKILYIKGTKIAIIWLKKHWAVKGDEEHVGAQIDLLIMRADNVVNLCEMKFANTSYTIDKDEAEKLQTRIESLKETLSAKQTVHLTMVTTYGVTYGKHSGIVQKQVMMDDLFA